ncbi:amino acid ABC transporter substrate-binding protein [Olsenella uli]|uniref:substrate-binding periplasmic protein n=1 Tax=Olsenella uli TaxID=133926 RepID=UPI00195673D3|nr:ABC transporter substrate-binding protein [Olsenella uli]MBM6675869.1 amino acid ABC transporter substrate-binding protein [Olsenella uli]
MSSTSISRSSFLGLLAMGAGALALAGCSSEPPADAPAEGAPEDVAGLHFTFIGDNNFKPYRYVETADDGSSTTVGLDIAVADELASRLGFTYEFKPMSFTGTLPAIQNKQADFSMALASNPEREETFDFTQGYYQPRVGVLTKEGAELADVAALDGHHLSCMTGTVQNQMLTELCPNAQISTYDTADQAMQEVVAGRVDAYVCDGAEGGSMAEANPGLVCTLLPDDETSDYVGAYRIMGWKGAPFIPAFDGALDDMKADGTLEGFIHTWVGPDFSYGD